MEPYCLCIFFLYLYKASAKILDATEEVNQGSPYVLKDLTLGYEKLKKKKATKGMYKRFEHINGSTEKSWES